MTKIRNIVLFADKLPPYYGGMEMHAAFFIKYFSTHEKYNIVGIITKNDNNQDILIENEQRQIIKLEDFLSFKKENIDIVFFNSGRWIEKINSIRKILSNSLFLYRTGGNEIIKASLLENKIPKHMSCPKIGCQFFCY